MTTIQANNYTIYFNQECYVFLNTYLEEKKYSKIIILADSNSNEVVLPIFLADIATEIPIEIIEIEPGEENKNIHTCLSIWETLTDLGADRKSVIINVGGGVITDLGGFVASTYKRGIDFINVPTTLLAMVDASIGGKNGVDLGILKNQIGTINVPNAVLIDTHFLATLPQTQMRSGLAEMYKHGLIFSKSYWDKLLDLSQLTSDDLDLLIHESIQIKNTIVVQDPTENGIRKCLNFGHTLGHAIESYCLENKNKTTLLHGEAIAIGMILESHIAWQKKYLTLEEFKQVKNTLLAMYDSVKFTPEDIDAILELLIHDKKNEYGKVQFALIEKIGKSLINQQADNKEIAFSFSDYNSY
jgi:3-dehydroquinate synthase